MSKGRYTYEDIGWVKTVGESIDEAKRIAPQCIGEKKPLWDTDCVKWIDEFDSVFTKVIRNTEAGHTADTLWDELCKLADPASMKFLFWQSAILDKAFPGEYWGWGRMMRSGTRYVLEVALPSGDGHVSSRKSVDFIAGCDAEAFDKVLVAYLDQDKTAPWYVVGLWYEDKEKKTDKLQVLKDFTAQINVGALP